jgi:hypothetical protein
MPPRAGEPRSLAATPAPAPAQQSAAIQPRSPETAAAGSTVGAAAVAAKPSAPEIRPTQEMPKVQDLE